MLFLDHSSATTYIDRLTPALFKNKRQLGVTVAAKDVEYNLVVHRGTVLEYFTAILMGRFMEDSSFPGYIIIRIFCIA
jgi:hypothetical protein